MSGDPQAQALERAILERADALVAEHLQQAEHIRDEIQRESRERLRSMERAATRQAEAQSEREYRRRIQASEIRMHEELDRLRWKLVEDSLRAVTERLRALREQDQHYLPLFKRLLAQAVAAIGQGPLVAQVCMGDLPRLREHWDELVQDLPPDVQISLSDDPIPCMGGVRVQTADARIRMDNTFEGRMERLHPELLKTIVNRLFPADSESEIFYHG